MKGHLITVTLSHEVFKQLIPDATLSSSRGNKLASQKVARIVEEYLRPSETKPDATETTAKKKTRTTR